jgi:hypothetical protein
MIGFLPSIIFKMMWGPAFYPLWVSPIQFMKYDGEAVPSVS